MAQSTVRLIVDAQNAIRPLKRVNEQTKELSKNTDKLKNLLNKGKKAFDKFGNSGKKASSNVNTLVGTLKKVAAAFAVIKAAQFVFFKTAELETQRKSLEVLTGSIEKTNGIIKELQDFGAVTPFTSSELIEQTKRLKAFGFETEELVDTTKRLSEVAGATGADLQGIATAFGQIRAKGKLQQEENLQLLERGVDITTELKRITGLQGDAFEKAQRQGKIGADLVNQALINLTNEGGAFFGGATAQATTLNGKLSTLQDSIENLARTIGTELEDEIKAVLDLAISAVKQINKLIESITTANKVGRANLAKITMEARSEARKQLREELGFFASLTDEGRKREKQLFEEIKAKKTQKVLDEKSFELVRKNAQEQENLNQTFIGRSLIQNEIIRKDEKTNRFTKSTNDELSKTNRLTAATNTQFFTGNLLLGNQNFLTQFRNNQLSETNRLQGAFNDNLNETNELTEGTNNQLGLSNRLQEAFNNEANQTNLLTAGINTQFLTTNSLLDDQKTEAEKLRTVFTGIGIEIKQGIVENLREAIKGSQSFGDALSNVLDRIGDKILDSGLETLVEGVSNAAQGKSNEGQKFGGAIGSVLGSISPLGPVGGIVGGTIGRLLPFANGGRPPVGQAALVGEKGPEIFVPRTAGTIIPNNELGGGTTNNYVTVNVQDGGVTSSGNNVDLNALGAAIGATVQAQLIKEKRPGGLLTR